MKRIQAFEFIDLPWYPNMFRRMQTDYLKLATTFGSGHKNLIPIIHNAMQHADTNTIIDLCSGSAGPWQGLYTFFQEAGIDLNLTLTDKFPQADIISEWKSKEHAGITYLPESIDAAEVPITLSGMRTLFEGFHHFKPDAARNILKNAKDNRSAIGIFEASLKPPAGWIILALSPIITILTYLFMAPFIKPRKISRFIWTYLIPVVPFATCWDGVISLLRVYCPDDLQELIAPLRTNEYHWDIGTVSTGTPIFEFTYLIGYPIKQS